MYKKKKYVIKTTNGETKEYNYYDIFDIVKKYMEANVKDFPSTADVDNYIPTFLKRFSKSVE